MASERPDAADEAAKASPELTIQTMSKQKRRRAKRKGPLQLQFLTATNPSQFRDEDAKRSVRSQAMIYWRHEEEKKKESSRTKSPASDQSGKENASGASTRFEGVHSFPMRTLQSECIHSQSSEWSDSHHKQLQHECSVADPCISFNRGSSRWQLTAAETASYFPRYRDGAKLIPDKSVTSYEESRRHEERQLRTMVVGLATFYNVGGSHDPFDVLPQFRNPHLDALYLSRNCMRAFASDSTLEKWLPLMLSHPHIILSSTVLASTWLDMHNNCSGDSTITTMVKAETIGMINDRLMNSALQLEDATLTVILHLFAGEMWICNETALRVHENGVATLVARRGGLSSFTSNKALAEVAAACCYHCDIFCEAEVLRPFREGLPMTAFLVDDETTLPESPLYCPRQTFLTVAEDPQCSPSTLDLLADMKLLTDVFVAYNTVRSANDKDRACLSTPDNAYEVTIQSIRARLSLLPSAHSPNTLVSGDWIYEACRIAALIYTVGITTGVPFSVAANPNCIDLLETSVSSSVGPSSVEQHHKPHLTETLFETLQRTNTSNVWKNMSGVLYWVSAVGAAAARIPGALDMSQRDRLGHEAYSVWVRRCLIMTATRTMIVLIFEQPTAILTAQRTLLKVQKLIRSRMSWRLEA